jgi:hypothetical protein
MIISEGMLMIVLKGDYPTGLSMVGLNQFLELLRVNPEDVWFSS